MSALPAPAETARLWTPVLSSEAYARRVSLYRQERRALGLLERQRYHWPNDVVSALARLTAPIDDVLDDVAPRARWWGRSPTRGALMIAMWRERQAFWGWDRERWVSVLCATAADVRQLVTAVAYLLCDHRDLHREFRGWKCGLFARRVFGQEPVDEAVARVQQHLDGLGYAAQLRRPNLQCALYELMLKAGSPVLEDLAGRSELIVALRSREQNNARRHGVEQLARTLLDMGVLAALPFGAQPTREEWLARSRAGEREVPAAWLAWAGAGSRPPRSLLRPASGSTTP